MFPLAVPYYHQETEFSCGSTCIQMVLEFFGVKKSEKTLRQLMNARPRIGTNHQSLIRALCNYGLSFRPHLKATFQDIESALNADHPVIINFIDPATSEGHYAVVTDMTAHTIVTHDPWNGPQTVYLREGFLDRWHNSTGRSQQWMLEVWKRR